MFQVKAPESFKSTLTIVGHGREQKLNLTYRHLSVADYASLLERLGDDTLSVAQAILDIVMDWDADVALDTAGVELALQQQAGLDGAIIGGYTQALQVARKGN
ncbi:MULTISPECIES: phage tail assembly chaperone [Stenotrophomonas]|uniref:Phage tail assembly chaperone n=1 Tax=Stenotrophomonas maltophilia TaxID=40324 RepID=A0AAD0FM97_STEMA|nr:phage tail assembly chaperone [Stenotrophomonas maltophilia]AUI05873.1 hypothetical protein SmaCSM2_01235 [Stenotrophomonas maltophilia]MBA2129505.1 hypothetical protein [Stenotrophomonas maltophilia]MBH1681363.1 hypothetical protein [Stenotrophomonas maltophilia]MBH1875844.1 hypothetical protein [Stenotrophomonas maltophilia]